MKTKLMVILTSLFLAVGLWGQDYRISKPGEVDAGGNPIPPGSHITLPDAKELKTMQIYFCNGPHGDQVWIRGDIFSKLTKAEAEKLTSQVCESN